MLAQSHGSEAGSSYLTWNSYQGDREGKEILLGLSAKHAGITSEMVQLEREKIS